MAFDFAKVKTLVRRTVHTTFGVRAFYQDSAMSEPVEIRVRWHNKLALTGDLDSQSYAEILQTVDRVILESAQARAVPVKRGGTLSFPDLGVSTEIVLATPEPPDGPFSEVWSVTR